MRPIAPPRRGTKLQDAVHQISAKSPRDAAIAYIQQHGDDDNARKSWKIASSYHARSIAETAMYRFKSHLGPSFRSRVFAKQQTEIAVKVKALNKIAALGTFPFNRAASICSP